MDNIENRYNELLKEIQELKTMFCVYSKNILTVEECSAYTSIKVSQLYKLTHSKQIPHYKPKGGKIYFSREEIDKWLLQGRQATITELKNKANTYCVTHKN